MRALGEVDEYGARVPIQFKTGKRVKIAEGQIQQHMEMLRVASSGLNLSCDARD